MTAELADGEVVVLTGANDLAGRWLTADQSTVPARHRPAGGHELTVRYLGDEATEPSQTTVTVEVAKGASRPRSDHEPRMTRSKVKKGPDHRAWMDPGRRPGHRARSWSDGR